MLLVTLTALIVQVLAKNVSSHCSLSKPNFKLAQIFPIQLQLDITYPSNGQVLPPLSNSNNKIAFSVLLAAGLQQHKNVDEWNEFAIKNGLKICFRLTSESEWECRPYESPAGFIIPETSPNGWHKLEGKIVDEKGNKYLDSSCRSSNNDASVRFFTGEFNPHRLCDSGCFTHALSSPRVVCEIEFLSPKNRESFRVSSDGSFVVNLKFLKAGNFTWNLGGVLDTGTLEVPNTGEHQLKFSNKLNLLGVQQLQIADCKIEVFLARTTTTTTTSLHIVTAADNNYYDRLANLIGSIHYWEASSPPKIIVYDLGLTPLNRELLETWNDVTVYDVDFEQLPPHFQTIPLVAYKAHVILDAISKIHEEEATVLWLDANTELRKPIAKVVEMIEDDGYFFTIAGHLFPTWMTVRNETLEFLWEGLGEWGWGGGELDLELTNECTSAIMGFRKKKKEKEEVWKEVLGEMNRCAVDVGCHYPKGSNFGNQKRDQSALNAILYHKKNIKCHADKIYWAYGTQESLRVEEDITKFNDIVFFSRRGVGGAPYIRMILPVAPRVERSGETIDVHFDTEVGGMGMVG